MCCVNDIQRHIRSLYARANTVIRKFYNCTVDIKYWYYLCLNPIVYPLIVHTYGYDIISTVTPNFELLLTMCTGVF